MRLSVDDKDPGYLPYVETGLKGQRVVVRLDGVLCTEVVTADTDEGFIVCFDRDENGLVVRGDEIVRATRRGKVEIELVTK